MPLRVFGTYRAARTMPRRLIRRYLPDPAELRKHRALRPLGKLLQNPEIWHLHRRSASGACFIGFFVAFLPVPGQMLVAGIAAVLARCNLPIAVALVWVTNPITMPPVFFFAYKLGALLLGHEPQVAHIDLTVAGLAAQLGEIWQPLLLGSLVCGWVSGVSAFVIMRLVWRFHVVRRWRERRESRRAAAANATPRATLPRG